MTSKVKYPLAFVAAAIAAFVTSTPARATEADDTLATSIKKTYVYQTYLKDDAVAVQVKGSVVTLTGTVASEEHKSLAQETAASMRGVTDVDNQLVTKAEVAADNADTWISRKVKYVLMFHRQTSASKTSVEVKDAIVTLRGEASSVAQKELTTEYAKDIEGVKEVKNEMTVAAVAAPAVQTAGEKMDDASITAQVKMALMSHQSTSAIKTKVETRDGEVTLTGIAKNQAEKSLVAKLVNDIQGVTSVNNQMTLEVTMTQ